jgi:hypothetical protein
MRSAIPSISGCQRGEGEGETATISEREGERGEENRKSASLQTRFLSRLPTLILLRTAVYCLLSVMYLSRNSYKLKLLSS